MVVVADGVGGQRAGEDASRIALETVARYVTESMECYYAGDPNSEQRFLEQLHESVMECHARVVEKARADPQRQGMATTLTLAIGHWPWAYVVQVGDSRCYQLHGGVLSQITRDQTVAQYLHDRGMINTSELEGSKYSHMLSSAIGGPEAVPAANRIKLHWNDAILLCSDGLPRHVPDDRIRERLLTTITSREACEALLQDALDGGGHDNITVVVGRARPGSNDAFQDEPE
jgi:protein phosphatase